VLLGRLLRVVRLLSRDRGQDRAVVLIATDPEVTPQWVDRSAIDPLGRDFWVRVDQDHRAILAAVAAQKPDDAQKAAEEHMREVRRVFLDSSPGGTTVRIDNPDGSIITAVGGA
jgi:hypothetical protein